MIEGLKTAGLNPSPSSLLQTITMIDLMSALVSDIQTVSGQTPTAFTSISVDSGTVTDLAITVGANGNGFYEESPTLLSVAIANTKVASFTTTGISTGTVDATTINATTGVITTVNATTVNSDTVNTTAGLVSALAVNVGANGNGFYEESSVQLGVSIGNTEVASFNPNGLATDGLLERVANVGIPFKLGSSGSLAIKAKEASADAAINRFITIATQVPVGAYVLAIQTRNDTIITATGAASYDVTLSGTIAIQSGIALTKNTKTNNMYFSVVDSPIVSGSPLDVVLDGGGGNTLDTGTVTAIVYYFELNAMDDHV